MILLISANNKIEIEADTKAELTDKSFNVALWDVIAVYKWFRIAEQSFVSASLG